MKQIVFFNNKGGVGKTTFIQHLGYALEKQGKKVLFIDADPQCNLTAYLCSVEEIDTFWKSRTSIYYVVQPLISGIGDFDTRITPYQIKGRNIWLLPGDILLSEFEQFLSERWVDVLAGRENGFRVTSAIYRFIENWANANHIDYVLVDVGPNLGALNRTVLLGCDYFIVPMLPDLFSLRGLSNLGITFVRWMTEWKDAMSRFQNRPFKLQNGKPVFAGYVTAHFNIYRKRMTKAWENWNSQIPERIKIDIIEKLRNFDKSLVVQLNGDKYYLGDMKNYHSLMPKSQNVHKPIFELNSKDGVIGSHANSVKECGKIYETFAKKICGKL